LQRKCECGGGPDCSCDSDSGPDHKKEKESPRNALHRKPTGGPAVLDSVTESFFHARAASRTSSSSASASNILIGAVNDPLEHEADQMADRVLRMPSIAPGPIQYSQHAASGSALRRTCARAASPKLAPPVVHDVLRSSGQPLDKTTRAFFEPRFGADLGSIRIHTDARAAESARSVGAYAYTVGSQIAFDSGVFAPHSDSGRRLLAHELAHVVQHTDLSSSLTQPLLSRAPRPGHCAGVWSCSGGSACNSPDVPGSGAASTSWQLTVNIDTDVESANDIKSADDIGHTYVLFSESNGTQYTYGFYPTHTQIPDAFWNTVVAGCMVHPDTDHKSCVDYTKTYQVTQDQYNKALKYAQSLCISPPKYDLYKWNCTTAAVEIAKQADQTPPSPRGTVDYTKQADNPNTLKEGYLDLDKPTRHLDSDSDIRDWVSSHTVADFQKIATAEKARLLNRLLEGWISGDDVSAFESICKGITGPAERSALTTATQTHVDGMNSSMQQSRVRAALNPGFITPPAPPVNIPTPPPPK
jgi:hypothetical protein